MAETKENLNKWEDIPYSWIRFNTVKIVTLPKIIYRLDTISTKIPVGFFGFDFSEINKLILVQGTPE